jgi:hypothetical protein
MSGHDAQGTAVVFRPPPGAITYPDSTRYKGGFGVRSETSNRLYKVSFDTAQGCWVCSCPGNIAHGDCKHLSANGLRGRRYGRQATPRFVVTAGR